MGINVNVRKGTLVKDLTSNFEGICTSFVEHMSGNIQVGIQPQITTEPDSGKPTSSAYPDAMFIDHHMVEEIGEGIMNRALPPDPNVTIKLGQTVEDPVSGIKGVAVSRIEHFNGCVTFSIQPPKLPDGKTARLEYIDHKRLKVVDDGVSQTRKTSPTGGPAMRVPAALR